MDATMTRYTMASKPDPGAWGRQVEALWEAHGKFLNPMGEARCCFVQGDTDGEACFLTFGLSPEDVSGAQEQLLAEPFAAALKAWPGPGPLRVVFFAPDPTRMVFFWAALKPALVIDSGRLHSFRPPPINRP